MSHKTPVFRSGRRFSRLTYAEDGMAAVEFALLAPILIIILLGVLDLGWRLLAEYKLTRAASAAAELVARARDLREADITDAFRASLEVAAPFTPDGDGAMVVSSVLDATGNHPLILWQRQFPAGMVVTSRLGVPGGTANLDAVDLAPGESVIVSEIFFSFKPLVGFLFDAPQELYYRWVAAPRFGALDEVLP